MIFDTTIYIRDNPGVHKVRVHRTPAFVHLYVKDDVNHGEAEILLTPDEAQKIQHMLRDARKAQ